jgi:hypothetical protein
MQKSWVLPRQDGRISTASPHRCEHELLAYTSRERGSDQEGALAILTAIRRAAPRLADLLICVQTPRHGLPGHTIHSPRSHRARAMVRRYLSCGGRDEGDGRIWIT